MREGNLEAPTRHPIDWKNPDFYDEAAAMKEMERVFDICHGCRRCVSLCQSFPTLFDLVDATDDGEVHGVKKEAYWSVVDQCYLCDLCYMTKCPYAAARVEPGLPAPDAARQGDQVPQGRGQGRREAARVHRRARQLRRHPGRGAGGQRGQRTKHRAAADGQPAGRAPGRLDARAGPQRFRWAARNRAPPRW
jgi:NAD-dependent dihydropyrimidine dehydrogenase PreA subunit